MQHLVYHEGTWNRKLADDFVLEVDFHLASKTLDDSLYESHQELLTLHPSQRKYLTPKARQQQFSAPANVVKNLTAYFKDYDLKVTESSATKRTMTVTGTSINFTRALGIVFHVYEKTSGDEYIMHDGNLRLPEELQGTISSFAGHTLSGQQETRVSTQTSSSTNSTTKKIQDIKGYSPTQITEYYDFPDADGTGECIGLIELGGTYKQSDIDGFFKHFGMEAPQIEVVGKPPAESYMDDYEVTLDLQLAGAMAPKAKLVIYYGKDLITAIKAALNDQKNKPSVLSISWAASEELYSKAQLTEMSQLLYQVALQGITVVAASGDTGAYNNKSHLNVNIPSVNPLVLGCGGSTLRIKNDREVIWNDLKKQKMGTGGGFSRKFFAPLYQQPASHFYIRRLPALACNWNYRGVPDIAANADPNTGYTVMLDGKLFPGGGTSASTPVWAGLIARLNQLLGYRLGFINGELYKLAATSAFRQVYQGDNGYYPGATYWNPCTGLGSPHGSNLLEALKVTT